MQRLRTRLRASASTGAPPSLSLDFLGLNQTLDSRVTFSRGSNATLVDSTGKVTYAPNNLLLRSQEFDNASWTKSNLTVIANVAVAPDGTNTADKIVKAAVTTQASILQSATTVVGAQTVSFFAKAAEYDTVSFTLYNSTDMHVARGQVNLSTGVVIVTQNGVIATQSVGNGWWRITATGTTTVAAGNTLYIYPKDTTTYLGDGVSGIYVWGAQLEAVTYQTTPSTYNATTASAYYGPRFDYDPVTLNPKGLLIEEQRSNLLTYSEQFDNAAWVKFAGTVSSNTIIAPDGTQTADTFTANGVSTGHRINQTVAGGSARAFSVYLKAGSANFAQILFDTDVAPWANFDLSNGTVGSSGTNQTPTITSVGNGWYRCTVYTASTTATSPNVAIVTSATSARGELNTSTGSINLWGAQLEAGAFATSYIPTVASTVTRSADVATMTGTNFSSWYNQSEGTFVASVDTLSATGHIFSADGGSTSERIFSYGIAGGGVVAGITAGGVSYYSQTVGAIVSNTPFNAATAYAANSANTAVNGTAGTTDTTVTLPTASIFRIGGSAAGAYLNGHIRRLTYYPTRLANYQLQGLTA